MGALGVETPENSGLRADIRVVPLVVDKHRLDLMEWNIIANTSEGRGVINQLLKWLPASKVPDAPSDPKTRSNPIINPAFPIK